MQILGGIFHHCKKRQHGIFLSSQKSKVLFAHYRKRIKRIFYHRKKDKAHIFTHHHAPCKSKLQALQAGQSYNLSLALLTDCPALNLWFLNLTIQKKGDEITTLNSRRHLCLACSLLLCLFLWQPCKHRPLRLRR